LNQLSERAVQQVSEIVKLIRQPLDGDKAEVDVEQEVIVEEQAQKELGIAVQEIQTAMSKIAEFRMATAPGVRASRAISQESIPRQLGATVVVNHQVEVLGASDSVARAIGALLAAAQKAQADRAAHLREPQYLYHAVRFLLNEN
jgi:hypothetical protein